MFKSKQAVTEELYRELDESIIEEIKQELRNYLEKGLSKPDWLNDSLLEGCS